MKTTSTRVDFLVSYDGSIALLRPLTAAAKNWLYHYIPDEHQEWAGAVIVEPRYLGAILDGIAAHGLVAR